MKPELATVLRAWRDRVTPEQSGMPGGGTRRTPGLRREELAALAGLSVDYIVRLEQGRATNPSPQVLGALARALRLTTDERDHLYRVAGAPVPAANDVPRFVTPSIQRVVDRLADTPVAVFSAAWDLLLWNPLWAALHGDPSGRKGNDTNLIWQYFVEGGSSVLYSDADSHLFRSQMVADLRAAYGRYPADAELGSLIDGLRANSREFTEFWNAANVGLRAATRKTIDNRQVGHITLDCDVLTTPANDLRVIVFTAQPGTSDADKLDLLRVAGLQVFARS